MTQHRRVFIDDRIKKSIFSIGHSLFVTAAVFVVFFSLFHIVSSFYISYVSNKGEQAFNAGIATDSTFLKAQGDEIAKNPLLIDALKTRDRPVALDIIKTEGQNRGITRVSITDAYGVIVGRAAYVDRYGDNVFLTAPAGRVVSHGRAVESIELTGFSNQIFMTTARPIRNDNREMVGALFANYMLDDQYAIRFKERYLSPDMEIVFYTKQFGVFGSSVTDFKSRAIIDSYFDSGSDWVKNGTSGQTVYFDGSNAYIVANVVFPGLESSPGGALLLIPRKDVSDSGHAILALACLLLFLVLAYTAHRKTRGEERSWRYYCILVCFAALVFLSAIALVKIQDSGRIRLQRIPYALYNSTIKLDPDFGIYNLGAEQHVSVVVDTGDEQINVVQAKLKFDPSLVSVVSIDQGTSSCKYLIEKMIDNKEGTVTLACAIVDTDPLRKSISIADVTLQPLRAGSAAILFDNQETQVLANDGLGTNVLRESQGASYRFDNFKAGLIQHATTSTATTTVSSFVVFSTTHPNESRWYNVSKAHFVWLGDPGAVYRYVFDTSPSTIPLGGHTIQGNALDVPIPGDGVYYFHLQLASGGPIAHYAIRSDMSPPIISAIKLSKSEIIEGDIVRFSFDATDIGSGVQRNYYIDLGNKLFLPVGQELFVPFMERGDQQVTLRVYDNAGNFTDAKEVIKVSRPQ